MKSINEINKKIGTLSELDQIKVIEITKELSEFKTNFPISSEGLKKLYNIQTRLHVFTEQYTDRLLRLLKQHHMVD